MRARATRLHFLIIKINELLTNFGTIKINEILLFLFHAMFSIRDKNGPLLHVSIKLKLASNSFQHTFLLLPQNVFLFHTPIQVFFFSFSTKRKRRRRRKGKKRGRRRGAGRKKRQIFNSLVWRFTGISKISFVKVQFFNTCYLFPKVFSCQISWNSNEWYPRNRCVSDSYAAFNRSFLTYYSCALFNWVLSLGYKEKSENCWVPCIRIPFLTNFCNKGLKLSTHCV